MTKAQDSPLWARLATVAVAGGVCLWFYEHNKRPEMGDVEARVAADEVEQYGTAKRNGDAFTACSKADLVAKAFLQAKDQAQYEAWTAIEKADCARAGVPMPP